MLKQSEIKKIACSSYYLLTITFQNSEQQKYLQLIQVGSIKCVILNFPNPIFIQPSAIEKKKPKGLCSYSCFITKMHVIQNSETDLKQHYLYMHMQMVKFL